MRVFPVLTADPTAVAVADGIRQGLLVAGLCVAALLIRASWQAGWQVARPGFRARLVALGLFTAVACGTELERLGDVVTLRLPLNIAAVVLALVSLLRQPPPPGPGDGTRG